MKYEMDRRSCLVAALGGAAAIATGCASQSPTETYEEPFSSIYISGELNQIVVLGSRFHYVFDAPVALVKLIRSDFHKHLKASFSGFSVHYGKSIQGMLTLMLDGESWIESASQLGMQRASNGEGVFSVELRGTRYLASRVVQPSQARTELNREYKVSIVDYSGFGQQPDPSPVGQSSNGLLNLLLVPLTPLLLFLVVCSGCKLVR